jgi:hypothetical protein
VNVRQIPAAQLPIAWPLIERRVATALKHSGGTYEADDVYDAIAAGEWQLWDDGVSITCTRVAEYPARRVLFIMLSAGSIVSIQTIWPALERFARANGCKDIRWMGRPGWRRSGKLPKGWRHTHDVIMVELADG